MNTRQFAYRGLSYTIKEYDDGTYKAHVSANNTTIGTFYSLSDAMEAAQSYIDEVLESV